MDAKPWKISPDRLGPLDSDIVRAIAGELTETFLGRLLSRENFVVRRRLAQLLSKHTGESYADVVMQGGARRRHLAEKVVRAELAERIREGPQ